MRLWRAAPPPRHERALGDVSRVSGLVTAFHGNEELLAIAWEPDATRTVARLRLDADEAPVPREGPRAGFCVDSTLLEGTTTLTSV